MGYHLADYCNTPAVNLKFIQCSVIYTHKHAHTCIHVCILCICYKLLFPPHSQSIIFAGRSWQLAQLVRRTGEVFAFLAVFSYNLNYICLFGRAKTSCRRFALCADCIKISIRMRTRPNWRSKATATHYEKR